MSSGGEDAELALLRARRMAELRTQQGVSADGSAGSAGLAGMHGGPSASNERSAESEESKQQAEAMRQTMLMQVLENDARQRLSRIAMVKPTNARAVEDMIIKMARSGQLRQKVSEPELINLLESLFGAKKQSKIVITRRGSPERSPSSGEGSPASAHGGLSSDDDDL